MITTGGQVYYFEKRQRKTAIILNIIRAIIFTTTTVAPVGVFNPYEAVIPIRKHTRDKITEQIVTLLNDLQRLIEVRAGKIISAEISSAPIILMLSLIHISEPTRR